MLERELREAAQAARDAGQILLDVYATDFSVTLKGVADPVTRADELSNALLVERLRSLFPNDAIVAEEGHDDRDTARRSRCWYVDPLDGTKEFIAKNGEFSVMIGLAIEGVAMLGVVYQPTADKLYTGIVGQRASLEHAGRTEELRVSERADPAEARLVVSRSHRGKSIDTFVERLGICHEEPSGSVGLKIGLLAEKQADLYVHPSDRSSAWDACAPDAILRAAGGRFTDCTGAPFRYGLTELRNTRGILATNAALFELVVPVARDVAREAGLPMTEV